MAGEPSSSSALMHDWSYFIRLYMAMSLYLSLVMSPPLHVSQVVYGQISTRTDYYKYSFYPFTVVQWNYLVATLTDLQTSG